MLLLLLKGTHGIHHVASGLRTALLRLSTADPCLVLSQQSPTQRKEASRKLHVKHKIRIGSSIYIKKKLHEHTTGGTGMSAIDMQCDTQ